ncbi:uncharacterized protein LOC110750147 [Prunus avium]|uniref:Uncharacterized protein LOC110750147 n=1 Tax=Prunus avium TaxID=42229 RepID=A0A6P5RWN5_PRUAV|nr:uncharacterized protein LOC110750147 [Prunus avium]
MDLQKGTQTVDEYLRHAKSIADSLAAINEPVTNKDLVTSILRGLGPDYKMLVTALLNFPPLPDFADLRAPLLAVQPPTYYSHRGGSVNRGSSRGRGRGNCGRQGRGWNQSQHQSPSLHYNGPFGSSRSWQPFQQSNSAPQWPTFSPWQPRPHPQPPSSWSNNSSQRSSAPGILGPPWCPTCNTTKHSHATCPHKFRGPESFPSFAGAQFLQPTDNTWNLDTGATHHMTGTATYL